MADNEPKPGLYKHYKRGDNYRVIGVATHEATREQLVVYRADYGEKRLFVRPLTVFMETVEWNDEQIPRFTYIEPAS